MTLLRCNVAGMVAIALALLAAWLTREPAYSAEERDRLAGRFAFRELALPSAGTGRPRSVRAVQPQLRKIRGWISSVGAAVALTDADRDGLPNDVCLVDPRTDSVTVAPAPATGRRFTPLLLDAAPLPYDARTMAPMGCLPGDFDEDGETDFLVYYWGRTPVLFLRERGGRAYERAELTPSRERWYTDAVTAGDIDGDGHVDLVIGNYFPDGARVLDARASSDPAMQMQDSMSRAYNGGVDRIFLSRGGARYREARDALPEDVARGWTLALGAADLDSDLLPELYLAHDFGPDALMVNRSTPGRVNLVEVRGRRGFTTPASKVLGRDSFKGMGVDFGDLDGDGRLDFMVSNITSSFALHESNLAFVRTGERLEAGRAAPFADRSERLGLARTGWAWDVKLGDFDNDGAAEIVQARGFLRGKRTRWPELHELAMANDELLRHPWAWPRFEPGDDLSGDKGTAFLVRGPRGRYVDLASRVGMGGRPISRAAATADVDADGRLDVAVAQQWARSHLYLNRAPRPGAFLGLDLRLPLAAGRETSVLPYPATDVPSRPAVGATAAVTTPGGRRLVGQVDGGNGHASARAPQLLLGLGRPRPERVEVQLAWRDTRGARRRAMLRLRPGWHTVILGARRA